MEPRVALASYDKASERFTIQVPTQGVSGNKVTSQKYSTCRMKRSAS